MPDAKVESYISGFGGVITDRLQAMRKTVTDAAPEAVEEFSYGLVGYKLNGNPLVYFGGFPNHTGFYATPNGHQAFTKDFSQYKQGKGSVQFPHDQPLPLALVKKVVEFRKFQLGTEGKGV